MRIDSASTTGKNASHADARCASVGGHLRELFLSGLPNGNGQTRGHGDGLENETRDLGIAEHSPADLIHVYFTHSRRLWGEGWG